MYHVKSAYRFDSSEYSTYAEAEAAAKVSATSGYEKIISKEVARVLPETDKATVVVKV